MRPREGPGDRQGGEGVGEFSRTVKNESLDFSEDGVRGAGLVALD